MQTLKTARVRRGYSQDVLAARAGIDQSTISRIESGERQPHLPTLLALADALDMSLNELVMKGSRVMYKERCPRCGQTVRRHGDLCSDCLRELANGDESAAT